MSHQIPEFDKTKTARIRDEFVWRIQKLNPFCMQHTRRIATKALWWQQNLLTGKQGDIECTLRWEDTSPNHVKKKRHLKVTAWWVQATHEQVIKVCSKLNDVNRQRRQYLFSKQMRRASHSLLADCWISLKLSNSILFLERYTGIKLNFKSKT